MSWRVATRRIHIIFRPLVVTASCRLVARVGDKDSCGQIRGAACVTRALVNWNSMPGHAIIFISGPLESVFGRQSASAAQHRTIAMTWGVEFGTEATWGMVVFGRIEERNEPIAS